MLTAAFRLVVCVCVCLCVWLFRDFSCCGVVMAYLSFCVFWLTTELLDSSWKSNKSCPHSCCNTVVRLICTQFDVWQIKIVYTIAVGVGIFASSSSRSTTWNFVNFVNQINLPKIRICSSTYDGFPTARTAFSTIIWWLCSSLFRWTQTRCSGIHDYAPSTEFSFKGGRLAQ